MKKPVIGILTYRRNRSFSEAAYFRSLVREGNTLGATVFLFSDQDVRQDTHEIHGFIPDLIKGWRHARFPWPDVVIDRRRTKWDAAFQKVRNNRQLLYANNKFTLKWRATQLFAETDEVKQWIPKTVLYTQEKLQKMLREFPILYVKPGNGTGGSSVVRIQQKSGLYFIKGRQKNGKTINLALKNASSVYAWLQKWQDTQNIRSGQFMIQQGLDLELVPNRNVDSRLLIQKDGSGQWNVTGIGVRVSGKGSPTTNLLYHDDGKAYPFNAFMTKFFGAAKARTIRFECEQMAHQLVQTIEQHFGSMMEYGLDVGVDVNGHVWLIEANPKPTRDLFLKIGEEDTYRTAVQRPLLYAKYLASQQGRKTNSEISEVSEVKAVDDKEVTGTLS